MIEGLAARQAQDNPSIAQVSFGHTVAVEAVDSESLYDTFLGSLTILLLALGTSMKQLGQFDNVYFPLAVSFYNRVFSLVGASTWRETQQYSTL